MLQEPARETTVVDAADVVVLGGGPAGIAAAVSAARMGSTTLLVERYGFLGGMGTAALVTTFCGLYASVDGHHEKVVSGVVDDLLEGMRRLDGLAAPQDAAGRTLVQAYDVAAYKCAADRVVQDSGARVRFHSLAVGAVVAGEQITALLLETKSGRQALAGKVFLDCSGDADLVAWSGAPWQKGDERGWLQYPTMMFRLGGVDSDRAQERGMPLLQDRLREAVERGEHQFPRISTILRPQPHPGEWRANMTQVSRAGEPIDGTSVEDLTYAELEGRRQVVAYAAFVRAHVPGFEQSYVQEIAPQIGIRETRRLMGRYTLTVEDVLAGATFDDSIGLNPWPVEKHVLGSIQWRWITPPGFHQLPYRALVPAAGPTNLLVAGRCLSATPDAQASARVSGPCFVMGQAAGTAAALAVRSNVPVGEVDHRLLQAELQRQGATLATG